VRAPDANKGDVGKILVIGGCRGMAGAPCLAARAAYRAGAGLVRIAVPDVIWDVVAIKTDESTTAGLPSTPRGTLSRGATDIILKELSGWADVCVMGPGMSQDGETLAGIRDITMQLPLPLVLDADGLNAFVGNLSSLQRSTGGNASIPGGRLRVLTPHPGEAARLLGSTAAKIQADRRNAVLQLVEKTGAVVVLKGAGTLVSDGSHLYENKTGNAGMATGGTGDVLSGVIGALIGQYMSGFDAACLGVYLHGLAGDIVAREKGQHSLIAGDLVEALPAAFLAHGTASAKRTRKPRS